MCVFVYLGRNSADLGWSSNISSSSKSTWSTQNPASPANDMWNKGTSRPPPGFNKNMNRSMSMPQGPSEKTSAFSPGTSNVYIKTTCLELVTKTFRLRIIIMWRPSNISCNSQDFLQSNELVALSVQSPRRSLATRNYRSHRNRNSARFFSYVCNGEKFKSRLPLLKMAYPLVLDVCLQL